MDRFKQIYSTQANQYDRLVARQDARGNLFAAITDVASLSGAVVAEWGAGTGRITRMLSVLARHIYAFDQSQAMLTVAAEQLEQTGMENWSLAVAEHMNVPLADNSVDLALQGWAFGHTMFWHPNTWRQRIAMSLDEMQRVVKPGGHIILIETMTTGARQPQPPNEELATLYDYWQRYYDFEYRWLRTDYQFASEAEAEELIPFFFSENEVDPSIWQGKLRLPECTGIWFKTVSAS